MVLVIAGIVAILFILLEAFEAIVLPRRVTRRFRLTRLFYRLMWVPWSTAAGRFSSTRIRENYLSFFGPLSLLLLLSAWAVGLILAFGVLHWALRTPIHAPNDAAGFWTDVYLSGTTFFTLGYGDVTPVAGLGRALAVAEAGIGFGFLALVIGYLPVIYQAFSRREVNISLLDTRAGSPPSAAELLRRHAKKWNELEELFNDWERWAADLMESHLSYPVLCYYRSQHNNQSWLSALTTILDACALAISVLEDCPAHQAKLTFAMARHAVVDLSQVFNMPPREPVPDRLGDEEMRRLRASLKDDGYKFRDDDGALRKLVELRQLYEPYANALGAYLMMPLPVWTPASEVTDNWQTSAWGKIAAGDAFDG
jgi:ion channel